MDILTQATVKVKPDRIDFLMLDDGRVAVVKMCKDGRRDIPINNEIKAADFDLEAALTWCRQNGYTVRTWPNGARAWKGEPWPIRTAHEILKLRRKLESEWAVQFRQNPGKWSRFDTLLSLDLAFDG